MTFYLSNKISFKNHIEPWTLFCQRLVTGTVGGGVNKDREVV